MIWIWAGFILFVLLMLALDLGVFHRNAHVVSIREALAWSAVWVSLGLAFGVFVYVGYEHHWMGLGLAVDAVDGQVNDGATAAVKYLTGYVIEKSLSVDNVFVIAMIFSFMAVPRIYQHRVLFWGILGALVMRGVMIAVGAELIARQGPSRTGDDVELATSRWVHWWNTQRLHSACGHVPPAEHEATYWADRQAAMAA